ncbi:cytoskeleton-associated protein 2-like [Mixophyes fleayi]|uniref:cytoskeleton-associated protein 2-like n=1 Tax=Mixophyes fleayi TaxID=3061075 RepID=UPI003F4DA4E6
MEVAKMLTAEEERRLKLLEYLAAKGKLKPQNISKQCLKDCSNLQNKIPPQISKQICEKKKDVFHRGTQFGFEASKNRTSNTGPLVCRSKAGKIHTWQTVSDNRFGNKALSRIPVPPKLCLPGSRPEQLDYAVQTRHEDNVVGSTLSSAVPESCENEAESGEEAGGRLTVTLAKSQREDKPVVSEICVTDKISLPNKRPAESGEVTRFQTKSTVKTRDKRISQSSRMSVARSLSSRLQAPNIKQLRESKIRPPAGKPVPLATTGCNHKVSIVSQPTSKHRITTERSFLTKSARTDGSHSHQPPSVHVTHMKDRTQRPSCTTKPKSTMLSDSSGLTAHKKSSDPVSIPQNRQRSFSYASKKASDGQSQHQLKSTALSACNKAAGRPQVEDNKQTNISERKQAVTNVTKESTTFTEPPNLAVGDANIRPHTPRMTAEDRKKKLEEWLTSKGKTYKRPPMTLPAKRPPTAQKRDTFSHSLWHEIEEEEELLVLSKKISQTLTECLELIKKGVSGETIHTALDKVPEAKRFAKYWVCKARLLEREGIFDVVELYKQGVQSGAMPIDELRDVVFDIMKNTSKKTKVVTFGPLPSEDVLVENEQCEDRDVQCCGSPTCSTIRPMGNVRTPCTVTGACDQGSAVKLQVASLSSKKEDGIGQQWKRLTPVRRSLRIHHSVSQYPEVVQEHDHVVSSLDELLDMADTDTYLYVRNEALPEEADHIIDMIKQDTLEEQNEGPV